MNYAGASGLGSVIYESVQKKLFQRMRIAQKGSIEGQSTRTVWAKLTSGITSKPATAGGGKEWVSENKFEGTYPICLMAGTLNKDGSIKGGFEQLYSRQYNFNFGQSIEYGEFNEGGEGYRAMPGITEITSTTEGELGSLKKASIKWKCWSLEQLEFLEKFFMKLGTNCLLEFGWSTGVLDDYMLWDTSNIETLGQSIRDAITTGKKRILDSGGEYECQSGLISNFNWQANDAGGFDCTTEIMSHGEPMVGARTNDAPMDSGGMSDEEKADLAESEKKSAEELEARAMNNMGKYLRHIDTELEEFFKNELGEANLGRLFKNSPSIPEDPNDPDSDYESAGTNRMIFPPPDINTIKDDRGMDEKAWAQIDVRGWADPDGGMFELGWDVNNHFITWGWLEDNILSKYMGRATKGYNMKFTIRSRDVANINEKGEIEYQNTRCSNHPIVMEAGTTSATVATTAETNPMYRGLGFKDFTAQRKRIKDDGTTEIIGDERTGEIRNIILNVYAIRTAFKNANTLMEGLEKLFAAVNEVFYGIFDFKIAVDQDNPTNMKVIDANYFANNPYSLLNNPSYETANSDGTFEGKYDSLFIFPSMLATNNIVTGQSMESKIPSEGMYAAISGNNKTTKSPDPGDKTNSVAANVQSDQKEGLYDPNMYAFNIPDRFDDESKYGDVYANVNRSLEPGKGPKLTKHATDEVDMDWFKDNGTEKNISSDTDDAVINEDGRRISPKQYFDDLGFWAKTKARFAAIGNAIVNVGGQQTVLDVEVKGAWEIDYWTKVLTLGTKQNPDGTLHDPVLIPLKVSFNIEGISGIYPGNAVHTDYIPKKYKDRVILVVVGVEHSVSPGGWSTSIDTMMVAAYNKDKYTGIGEYVFVDDDAQAKELAIKNKAEADAKAKADALAAEEAEAARRAALTDEERRREDLVNEGYRPGMIKDGTIVVHDSDENDPDFGFRTWEELNNDWHWHTRREPIRKPEPEVSTIEEPREGPRQDAYRNDQTGVTERTPGRKTVSH